jgi:hypothetical protein
LGAAESGYPFHYNNSIFEHQQSGLWDEGVPARREACKEEDTIFLRILSNGSKAASTLRRVDATL